MTDRVFTGKETLCCGVADEKNQRPIWRVVFVKVASSKEGNAEQAQKSWRNGLQGAAWTLRNWRLFSVGPGVRRACEAGAERQRVDQRNRFDARCVL